jgi:acetylornithine/N-succinyldiaminopimelate aminotransferase
MTTDPTDDLITLGRAHVSRNYAPAPVVMSHGDGMRVWDTRGRCYLDFAAGIAVSSLGHAHPALVEALQTQAGRLLHISNGFLNAPQVHLQARLARATGLERVYLCNSGAEANEAAIKLVRRAQRVVRGTPRFEVITFEGSFHGRTYGAISATAQPKYHAGFEPMVPGFVAVPWQNLAAVEQVIGPHTAAILVEPVQGEGGVRPACQPFLQGLRQLCDRHGLALIFDEVQTGVGRTGHLFAADAYGVRPDVMTIAKGIAGGVPLGAMLSAEAWSNGFERGSHATTYGGNPLACAAANCVLDHVEEPHFLERVRQLGRSLRAALTGLCQRHPTLLVEARGLGLLTGLVTRLDASGASSLVTACREAGILLTTAGGNVVRFSPPLIAGQEALTEAVAIMDGVLDSFRPPERA